MRGDRREPVSNAGVTGSPALSASPCGLTGYALGGKMIEKLKWNDATKKLPDDAGTVLLWVRTAKPFSNPVWMTGYFDEGDWHASDTGNVVYGIVTYWAEPNGPGA